MARVIKGSEVAGLGRDTGLGEAPTGHVGKVISGDKYAATAEAQAIRDRARAEAQGILDEARAEAERIRQEAFESANRQGYEEGRERGAAELAEVVATFSQRMQQVEAQAVPQLKQLAVTIARKILGRELEFQPEGVVDIVRQALSDKARLRREIYLRVHPDDMDFIRQDKPALLEVLSRCKEIGLREDPDVARHGVIIETDAGLIDAQLETQLQVFERILKDVG